jgi:hypothetical protein
MKELSKVYVNNIKKINNNKEVFYSYKENNEKDNIITTDRFELQNRIDSLFRSSDFIYKKKFHIKTKYDEKDYVIISKCYDYLLTIDGERIYIDNILEIN